jgi:hypothetical protein
MATDGAVVAVVAAVRAVVAAVASITAVATVVTIVEDKVATSPLDHGELLELSANPWILKARPFTLGSLSTS